LYWPLGTITLNILDRARGYTITGAPYIAKDRVVIGNAGAEFDARGYITAYDHATGEQRWRFFIVPGDPELGFEHPELELAATTWATHVDKQTGKPVETGQGEYFHEPKLVFPSPAGGHNWQPMAFNPETGLAYIPVIEASTIWVMPQEPFEYQKGGLNFTSSYIFPMPGEWGLDGEAAKGLPPLEELAEGQPDTTIREFVRAWDPVTQKLAWEVETSGQWVGELFATWNGGGLMTSAAGLVFQGRGTGEFAVLDAVTGEQLHSIDTGTSMMAGPMTYTVGGEQYVAIMAGLGGAAGQEYFPGTAAYKYGNKGRIIAFKLGDG